MALPRSAAGCPLNPDFAANARRTSGATVRYFATMCWRFHGGKPVLSKPA
ncbi:hypothetical protein KCP74_23470 [Salmonella enterica subsp. enterica]|nr:hypothetical protein KCP74_23470 [Salmonella enterica subsp. enterica]